MRMWPVNPVMQVVCLKILRNSAFSVIPVRGGLQPVQCRKVTSELPVSVAIAIPLPHGQL